MPNYRAPLTAPIVSLLIASFIVQPTVGWTESAQEAAERARVIREMRLGRGREHLVNGKKALGNKDYEAAFGFFRAAVDDIPDAPATRGPREDAVDGLTKSGNKLAEQRVTEGYYVSAIQVLQEVLRFNPNDKRTLKLAANIEAPDYFEKQITPGHRANVEKVKQLFIEAQGYKNIGRFDMAHRKAEEIIGIDPYNIAAKKLIEELNGQHMHQSDMAGYNATRATAMHELDSAWQRPYRRFNRVVRVMETSGVGQRIDTARINKKLTGIVLPKVEFREATVREAIEFLVQKSKSLDPENEGVNIVLKLDDAGGGISAPMAPPPPAGIPGLPVDPGAAAPPPVMTPSGGAGTKITLSLNNVPLIEVVKYITNLANLKFKVEPFAVSILPLGASTEEMLIREWKVSSNMFKESTAAPAPADPTAAPPPSALGTTVQARDYLTGKGVTFNAGAFAMFSRASSTLVVKNTQDQLDLVERIIEIEGDINAIKQIEITAKFVEITQNNLKELSFDWLLGQANVPGLSTQSLFFSGGTPGTGPAINGADFPFQGGIGPTGTSQPLGGQPVTNGNRSGQLGISANAIDALLFGIPGSSQIAPGIAALVGITDPSFQVVMRGLDQKKGVDLLSAPRVTTKSGNRAVIEIIREFRYPIEFEQPQIPQNFGSITGGALLPGGATSAASFPVTPTTPTTFETKNTGVTLEVEPTIGPDGASIDMNLAPQVVEFEGFINYGSPIQSSSTNALGQTVTNIITPNVINQPIFSTRKVQTNVTVFDGATVVLGGLVREDVQKVSDKTPILGDLPVFGRLFRSEIDQHIKRNLVIFVSARIINAEGQPVTSDEEKEEVVDQLPLPMAESRALPDISGFSKDRMK